MLEIQHLYHNLGLGMDQFAEHLEQELGIRCKKYPEEGLYVFNYSQTESPKTNPIVMECRGLILDVEANVVCQPFTRFFNLGEALDITGDFDITEATCFEKADGSLVKIFHWNEQWHVATRGTAFAETENYTGRTFEELIFEAFGVKDKNEFTEKMSGFGKKYTFIFEYTSPDNRVVTPYTESEMVLLGMCSNNSEEGQLYLTPTSLDIVASSFNKVGLKCRAPKSYSFSSIDEMKKMVQELPNLEEGYVCVDYKNQLRVKIKSPQYVAVHRLRGEHGRPTEKNIASLVITGETEEYLIYFPEDRSFFEPYMESYEHLRRDIVDYWEQVKHIEDQKEFALKVKDHSWAFLMFQAKRANICPTEAFVNAKEKQKVDVLLHYHNKGDK